MDVTNVDGCHSQSRYNRVFLSPILDHKGAQLRADFFMLGQNRLNLRFLDALRNILLYLFCDVTFDYREHPENSQLYVPEICHWLFYPKHYILGPYELVINNDAIKNESVCSIP
jgi:hypothetical protein